MKILVTYFSQTGNTKQVAEAIREELSTAHEVDLKTVEETGVEVLDNYNLVFLGTPIHAGGIAAKARELFEAIPSNPKYKMAGFITHAAFAYEPQSFEKGLLYLQETSRQKGLAWLGSFDCQGRLSPAIQPRVQQARKMSDEDWAARMAKIDPHPDAEDLRNAQAFAREVLAK